MAKNGRGTKKGADSAHRPYSVLPVCEAMMLRGASTAALAIFLVTITYAVYRSDNRANLNDPYDECVVNEMRGKMEPEARKTCARRFGVIFDITNTGIVIDWRLIAVRQPSPSSIPLYSVALRVPRNNTEWNVSKAVVNYAYSRCDAQPPANLNEFTGPYTAEFKNDLANITLPGKYDQRQQKYVPPGCQKVVQLWGRYR